MAGRGATGGRRVAVTGVGVVASCGVGKDAFWEGLLREAGLGAVVSEQFRLGCGNLGKLTFERRRNGGMQLLAAGAQQSRIAASCTSACLKRYEA